MLGVIFGTVGTQILDWTVGEHLVVDVRRKPGLDKINNLQNQCNLIYMGCQLGINL